MIYPLSRRVAVLLMLVYFSFSPFAEAQNAEIIGRSADGRPIELIRLSEGPRTVLIIGGIHGGYEWNTILLVDELVNYLRRNSAAVPRNIGLYILPNMNPDGLYRIAGGASVREFDFSEVATAPGRFNGNGVDLNRNWDNDWSSTAWWGNREVDPGSAPFSEPETRAVRDLALELEPAAILFYHSAANGIYYGGRREQWPPALAIARAYSRGSGYRLPSPDGEGLVTYPITGAASNYFRTRGIPSMVVELATHHLTEFDRNLAGLKSLLRHIAGSDQ